MLLKGQKQLIRVCVFRMEDKMKVFFLPCQHKDR